MKISDTSLTKLSICSQQKFKHRYPNFDCGQFQNLVHLDIRNNQLGHLDATGLSHLTDVYLSGKITIANHSFENTRMSNWGNIVYILSNETFHFEQTRKLLEVL